MGDSWGSKDAVRMEEHWSGVLSVQEIYTHFWLFLPKFFHNKNILNIYSYCITPWLEQRAWGDANIIEGGEHGRLLAT